MALALPALVRVYSIHPVTAVRKFKTGAAPCRAVMGYVGSCNTLLLALQLRDSTQCDEGCVNAVC